MQSAAIYDPGSTGTKGLVFIGRQIVVLRRDTNTALYPLMLDLPGGAQEGKETIFETFKRELLEELNLAIALSDITYLRRYSSALQPGKTAYFLAACLPENAMRDIVLGDESTEYLLMPPAEFLERTDAIDFMQSRVADYLAA